MRENSLFIGWLSKALRPVTVADGNIGRIPQKRLIWAYDEIQSLDSLKIPTASELFGDELGQLVTGEYGNGIQKQRLCLDVIESLEKF